MHLEAVAAGQPEVEHHEVEVVVAGEGGRLLAVVDGDGGEAVAAQALLDERGDARLVVDDQDPVHRGLHGQRQPDP